MIKKRFISMLVLLAAVATGAWAQWTGGTYTATANENVSAISVTSDATLTINKGVTVTVNGGINATGHTLTVAGSGTLVVKGSNGNNGNNAIDKGGSGGNGGNGVTGNLIVDGANVTITGGNGGNGGRSECEEGGNGGNGGNGVSGNVTVNGGSATINGGNGGNGGQGEGENGSSGSSALAYSGTLTLGANVTLYEGTNASGTVLDGNTGSSRVYSGAKKQNMYAETKVVVTSITFDPATASMTLGGETLTLTPTVLPADAMDKTVTWTTSDESVATVANGVVTAVGAGTATITATANDGSGVTGTCTVTVADPATKYDLTKADGSEAHGTVAFTVGGNAATQAKKDDVVTVSVTPNEGYSAKDVTVRGYTSWAGARGMNRAPELLDDITVTKQENGTWTFTMPEANVWVVVTYTKNLQDAWIQAITDQTYTGSAIEPTIEVKDGETTLTLNTDYTVAYSNNVNAGEATVTVTGTGNYSGTATANFTIVADKSALNTAIGEAETYYNSIKDDHAEAAAALKTAIDNAKTMQEKGDATQEEVNNALSALTTAKTSAEGTVLTETKTTLNNDITEAEAYYNSISESNPEAATTLQAAINAAKAVKDNADATQAEVDDAKTTLDAAVNTAKQAVLTEAKNKLAEDITAAETYYESIKDNHSDAATALKAAIDAAKSVKDNADATQEQVDAAIAALAAAKTTAEGAVLTDTKNKLAEDITAAETYYESIKDDYSDAATALKAAIDAAKGVKDNTDATQEQVDAAIAALASAKTTAEQTVLTETKTALNDDITEAEAYYNGIKDSNPEAANDLKDAIDAAKAVKDNPDATQAEVEAAIAALSTASNTAKVEVSRVTLTIPAKSYVSRIDADNRQIENAVTGVKLYTVTSVTDKQVVLSNELSVVPAETPYLIYNDNDEEKTINLIVSSSDADNVAYDSEHFKGTLVDKTFTDENMQEADHYVLSNGHNFVWVKDAGTLAGGKCWIELTKAAGARRLSIVAGGEATGIDLAPVLTEDEGAWYDLNGRRVVKPTKKGLYIKNGKKYVVK